MFAVSKKPDDVSGKRLVCFSYGSGLAAAMFSVRVASDCGPKSALASLMANINDIPTRLSSRTIVPPAQFEEIMKLREETHHKAPYVPQGKATDLFPGTFYLTAVDDKHRRAYSQVSDEMSATVTNGVH